MAAAILTGGAVLRVAARVFAGWGSDPIEAAEKGGKLREERETKGGYHGVPAVMIGPAAVLVFLGLLLGMSSRVVRVAQSAAAQLEDRTAYIASVLGPPSAPAVPRSVAPAEFGGVLRGVGSCTGAILLAGVAMFRRRWQRHIALLRARRLEAAMKPLRALHSGHAGDYVAWLTAGVVVFAAAFIRALR